MTMCKWWRELDLDNGVTREWCSAIRCAATCSGVESQCLDNRFFNAPKSLIPHLLFMRGVERTTAEVDI